MRIETQNLVTLNATPSVLISHKGSQLVFTISFYRRTVFLKEYDVFEHLNAYWATLPAADQDSIFNIYSELFEILGSVVLSDTFEIQLKQKIAELLRHHTVDRVLEWARFRATNLHFPSSIPDQYVYSPENNSTRGKTYTKADYLPLIALAISLRSLMPVWGEYMSAVKRDPDIMFKAMIAFKLIENTPLMESIPMTKLADYIEGTIESMKKTNMGNVLNGVPRDDYPQWILAMLCVHQLTSADIRGLSPTAHLITFIHMGIKQRIDPNTSGSASVRDKQLPDDEGSEHNSRDQHTSALERYKLRTPISTGDIVELENNLANPYDVAYRLCSLTDMNDVARCIENMRHYPGVVDNCQIRLLQWVLKPVISPKGINYLHHQLILQMLGVAEAVLWASNHKYLSLFMTCTPAESANGIVASPMAHRMRIPKAQMDKIHELYPFKPNVRTSAQSGPEPNFVLQAINQLVTDMTRRSWTITTLDSRVEEVLLQKTRRLPIIPSVQSEIATLVVDIGSRNYK